MENLDNENFDSSIKQDNWIIEFGAEWCNPCKIMDPHFKAAEADNPKINFAKVDIDGNQELAQRFGIMSVPTTLLFKNNECVESTSGALDKDQIQDLINSNF